MCLRSMYCRSVHIWSTQPGPHLKPCCSQIICSQEGVRRRRRIEANNFEITGVRLRLSFCKLFLIFLKIGIMVNSPQHTGTSSECQISINSCLMAGARVVPPSLERSEGSSLAQLLYSVTNVWLRLGLHLHMAVSLAHSTYFESIMFLYPHVHTKIWKTDVYKILPIFPYFCRFTDFCFLSSNLPDDLRECPDVCWSNRRFHFYFPYPPAFAIPMQALSDLATHPSIFFCKRW